jgi:very-short-patch-repair endonuclease
MKRWFPKNESQTWTNDLIGLLFQQNGLDCFQREVAVRNMTGSGTYHIDFAFTVNHKQVAVEFQGGVFKRGGGWHQNSARYASDSRKARWLALNGWTILAFTALDMQSPALVIAEIKAALGLLPVEDVAKLAALST